VGESFAFVLLIILGMPLIPPSSLQVRRFALISDNSNQKSKLLAVELVIAAYSEEAQK
jgi:hypothetical protein